MNLHKRLVALAALGCATLAGAAVFAADSNTSGVPVPAAPKFDKGDPAAYGKALANYMDSFDSGWKDFYAAVDMTLIDSKGDKVLRKVAFMVLEQTEGDKTILRFRSPADIRGITALVHEHPGSTDDTWLYLPASRRTRRISGANRTASFQGTEFTYEDIARFTVQNYSYKFLGEATVNGEPVYNLEAKPNYKDTGYSKLVVSINRKFWRIEQIVYHDKAGRQLKTLTQSKWKQFHGRFWRPGMLTMANQQTRKTTTVNATSMFLNLALYKRPDGTARSNLTAEQFTKRALEEK
jgi:hypothetical protein